LNQCRLPLSDPKSGELIGKFIIHNVEIGPGPLIREMAVLMERETPAKLRQESVVSFQMHGGRIYHDDMELLFPDFTIHTKGSVGIDDQSLSLTVEMPIPPKWLQNNPAATALQNQTLSLPVAGTLSKPQLDKNRLDEYAKQFIRKAAGNLIEEGVNKGLEQLFKKQGR
jgi:translocation and assembly module TamB